MKKVYIFLIIAMFIITGCSGKVALPTTTPTAPAQIPDGVYIQTITLDEFSLLGETGACMMAGTTKLRVSGNIWSWEGTPLDECQGKITTYLYEATGNFEYKGDQVAMHFNLTAVPCTPMDATYEWTLGGNQVQFTTVESSCETQLSIAIAKEPWIKQ
jgi:hypothetical protein